MDLDRFGRRLGRRLLRAGMLLALVAAHRPRPLTVPAGHRLRWGAVLLLALPFVALAGVPSPVPASDLAGLGFVALLASTVLVAGSPPWARIVAARPLRALGAWSYGLYLWHQPIERALIRHQWLLHGTRASYLPDLAILLALALPLAAATYYAIERPALARAPRRAPASPPVAPAALTSRPAA